MTTGPEYLKQYRERTVAGGGLRAREWDHYDELEKTLEPAAYAARQAAGAREYSLKRARTLSIEDLEMLLHEARGNRAMPLQDHAGDIRDAVTAEREACAKLAGATALAWDNTLGGRMIGEEVSKAIRARAMVAEERGAK